jgi:hypothetical protein
MWSELTLIARTGVALVPFSFIAMPTLSPRISECLYSAAVSLAGQPEHQLV